MKRYSTLPRNYLRRPEIRGLVPDLKLLMLCVYVSCESHVGAFLPGGLSEESGLEAEALAGGLADLIRRGLLVFDESTGEVFISSFFRDNVFNTPARRGQAVDDFRRVESQVLRNEILAAVEKNPGCGLTIEGLKPGEKQGEKPCFVEKQTLTLLGGGRGRGRDRGREVVAGLADLATTTAPLPVSQPQPQPQRQPPGVVNGIRCWGEGLNPTTPPPIHGGAGLKSGPKSVNRICKQKVVVVNAGGDDEAPGTTTTAPLPVSQPQPQPQPQRQPPDVVLGVRCWSEGDRGRVQAAVGRYGQEVVSRVAGELAARLGKLPLPSHVEDSLAAMEKQEAARVYSSITRQAQERQDVEALPREQGLEKVRRLKESLRGVSHV